jgi:Fe-S-cluster formation regulator IscX/YfhJ
VASGLGELVPDVEPLTVVLVDLLTTDLNLDGGDESVTDRVNPRAMEATIPVSLMAGISTRTCG